VNELQLVNRRLRRVAACILTVFAAGILGYRFIEGWSFFDALYMTVITLATVGYGETHPLSSLGRAFTIALIMTGIGVLTYAITSLTELVVEGDIRNALRRHRMEQKIAALEGH
jgi:voltage-gated potassium channel